QKDVFISGGFGLKKITQFGNAAGDQALVYQPVLLRRKYMLPDGKVVAVTVNQFEGQHALNKACLGQNKREYAARSIKSA
ncbi:MAG TPA: hypothetical protein VN577_17540, partial [Terriglobales bacterium]|nr:hypothetical protein [Terriglobales bacterium]